MENQKDIRKLADYIVEALTKTTYPPYPTVLNALSGAINELIQKDYNKLVAILYEVDVDEERLKKLLRENNGKDAGRIIAELIIERQEEKIRTRQQFKRNTEIDDEEKW